MAGPNKDLFKRALSRIATKGNQPQAPNGSNWQGVAPQPAPPAPPASPAATAPAPAPTAPAAAPPSPSPAPGGVKELSEDDLIAQIEAEEEALMSIGGGLGAAPAAAPAKPAAPPVPASAPPARAPTPPPTPTPPAPPPPAAARPPAPTPAPAAAPSSNGANGSAASRTARDAAAAMVSRLSARRGGSGPTGVGHAAAAETGTADPVLPSFSEVTAPAAAPAPAAPPVSASAPTEKIIAEDRRAPASDRRSGGDRRNEAAAGAGIPFASMAPIASAERKGGLGATFVPAAGPIPFAHIGAFRWLMPTQAVVISKANGHDASVAPTSAPVPTAAPPVPPPVPSPPPASVAVSAPPVAPPPVASPPVVAPPVAAPPVVAAPVVSPADNDFLKKLNFAALDPMAGAKDVNGDGITGLSDVLEPEAPDDVMDFGAATVPSTLPPPIAAAPMPAPTPVPGPTPLPTPVPVAAPAHAAPVPAHNHGAAPAAADPAHASPLHVHAPAPTPATPPPAPVPTATPAPASALSGSATLAAAELLKGTVAALGTQVRERDDIARIVLSYATQRFKRAALFVIKKEMLVGWEGGGSEVSRAAVRGIMVPLTNPSIFKTVFETKVLYCGGVPHTTVNDIFFNALGDPRPERVVVVPFVLKDKVACVLYADGGDIDDENPASIGELYQLGRAVSSAFENLILRAKRT